MKYIIKYYWNKWEYIRGPSIKKNNFLHWWCETDINRASIFDLKTARYYYFLLLKSDYNIKYISNIKIIIKE